MECQKSDPLQNIPRQTLGDQVATAITSAISVGRLKPGDRLVERDLAEILGVSRVPIREALKELEAIGLLVRISHKGTYVRDWTARDAEELCTYRSVIEGFAARLAARESDEADLANLEETLKRIKEAESAEDMLRTLSADLAFHEAVVNASKHTLLKRAFASISPLIRMLMAYQKYIYTLDIELEELVSTHMQIAEAIRRRDEDGAERAMIAHIQDVGQRIVPKMEQAVDLPLD